MVQHFARKIYDQGVPNHQLALGYKRIVETTPALLDLLTPSIPSDLGFDVLPRLAGRMFAYPVSDYLMDIGTLQNYELAQANWPGL